MALIVCPECGQNISNKADHCIHCGCRIITCPECDTVYLEEVPVCAECGYVFKKQPVPVVKAKQAEENKPKFKTLADANAAWSNQLLESNGGCALGILFLIFLLTPVILSIIWKYWPSILYGYFNTLFLIQACFAALAVVQLIDSIRGHFVLTSTKQAQRLMFWADGQGINLKELLKKEIMTTKKDLTLDQCSSRLGLIHTMAMNIMLTEDKTKQHSQQTKDTLVFFISLTSGILFFAFIFLNVPIYMLVEMEGDYGFSSVNHWWALGAAIVLYLIEALVDKDPVRDAKVWIRNSMPEVVESYDNITAEYQRLKKLSQKYGKEDADDPEM